MTRDITYRLATPEDHDVILSLLRENFYREEPMSMSCRPFEPETYDEVENMALLREEDQSSVVAMCGDQIVGVILCGSKGPNEAAQWLERAAKIPGTNTAKCAQFLASVERNANVFEKYNADRAIHGHVLSVRRDLRGKGIGYKLYEKAIQRAAELGYPLFVTDCTSIYSANLCERLGLECVNVSSFQDYRLPGSDTQVFFPPKEHQFLRTYVKKLF